MQSSQPPILSFRSGLSVQDAADIMQFACDHKDSLVWSGQGGDVFYDKDKKYFYKIARVSAQNSYPLLSTKYYNEVTSLTYAPYLGIDTVSCFRSGLFSQDAYGEVKPLNKARSDREKISILSTPEVEGVKFIRFADDQTIDPAWRCQVAKQVAAKSVAVRLVFRDHDRTMSNIFLDPVSKNITHIDFGAAVVPEKKNDSLVEWFNKNDIGSKWDLSKEAEISKEELTVMLHQKKQKMDTYKKNFLPLHYAVLSHRIKESLEFVKTYDRFV